MPKHKVFITRPIPEAGLELLKRRKSITLKVYPKHRKIPRQELLKGVRGVDAILSLLTEKMDGKVLDAAGPKLKIVSNFAVGVDNIDLAACEERGIKVANTPGVLTDAVAEHTFALIMSIARRIAEADRFTKAGKYEGWGPMMLLGTQIKDKTLGIIGLGRIGSGVAERTVRGMGMKVAYYDIRRNRDFEMAFGARFMKLDDLVSKADFISLHVPLLPSTRHLMDAQRLRRMKKTAYLINTSRGPVVDEKALTRALRTKDIAGAALDVLEDEPKIAPGLAKLDNVILTPHIASGTIETRSAMAKLAAQAIIDVLDGKRPKNLVKRIKAK